MKELTSCKWGVSNRYKVERLNQIIGGWIKYFKTGSMKLLCRDMDKHIRYQLLMCIWRHWKAPQNRAKNLIKLDVYGWAACKIAYCDNKYTRLAHNGCIHKVISNKRPAIFILVSILDYYTEKVCYLLS